MSSFRVCPTGDPNITRMEFDYYHLESGNKFEEYFKFVRQVAMEDYELCERAQENLQKGVYNEGILNPVKETGVVCELKPALLLSWFLRPIKKLMFGFFQTTKTVSLTWLLSSIGSRNRLSV